MRTTLTFEPDVAVQLERRRREGERSFKDEVNRLLRLGLLHDEDRARADRVPHYRVEPFAVGELLVDVNDITAALEVAEAAEQP